MYIFIQLFYSTYTYKDYGNLKWNPPSKKKELTKLIDIYDQVSID